MKKIAKWAGIIIAIPILLFILLVLLFYFPPFQNWAVKRVAAYASEKTGMEITVNHVNLEFPLDLGIDGIKAIQQNDSLPQVKDTVADIGHTVADIQLLPLFHKQVQIDELRFEDMKVNTTNFIHQARIKGNVGLLALKSHGIDLGASAVKVDEALFKNAKLSVELSDTVPPDTTPSKNFWKITLDKVNFHHTDFTLHMPGDTLSVHAYMGNVAASNGFLDLHKSLYQIGKLDWQDGNLYYDNNFETHQKGLDYNHLALEDLLLKADSFYYCDSKLDIKIRQCRFKEQSGLIVDDFQGPFSMDSTSIRLPKMHLKTTESDLDVQFIMDKNAFAERHPGKLDVTVHGSIGKQDMLKFMASAPAGLMRRWPNYPLRVDGVVRGNMQKVHLSGLTVKLPTAFNVYADGFMENLTDPKHLKANLDVDAHSYNLNFLTSMLDPSLMRQIRIPNGIGLKGHFNVDGQKYGGNFIAREGRGSLSGTAQLDAKNMVYRAKLKANNLQLQHFVPNMGLHAFSGYVEANGAGTDFLSSRTRLNAKVKIQKFQYGGYNLDNMNAVAAIRNGRIHADVDSKNRLLKGLLTFDGITSKKVLRGTFSCDLSKADLHRLGITQDSIITAICSHVDIKSNFKDYYKVQGLVSDIFVQDNGKRYHPDDIVLDVLTSRDTTHAVVDCGDFHLNANAKYGYQRIMKQLLSFMGELQKQLKNKYIDQVRLRKRLPNARIYLTSGRDNFFCGILRKYGYDLASIYMDMDSSPMAGLNGNLKIDSLIVDSIRLDTIRFAIASDSVGATYKAQVRNGKNNPAYTFNALFDGGINEHGTQLSTKVYDADDKLGLRLGLSAQMEQKGIRLHMFGDNPILGYKKFNVNDSNYVFLGDDRRVSADLKLRADDGMGLQIYTNDDNLEALQDVTVSLHQFDLEKVLSVIPYTPDIAGVMDGDFHLIQTKDELSVSSEVDVSKMFYEKYPMGDVGAEFVYIPKPDGTHYVDGILKHDGNEVGTLKGTYSSKGSGFLDATVGMKRLPMDMANGFIPNRIIGFKGYGDGTLTVRGSLKKPQVDGEVYLDSCHLLSEPYGLDMRFANDPVRIVGSNLLFENFEMYANNDSPLNISGKFDFSDLDRMLLDIRMKAENFELIDAKENPRSEAYGKAFVNFFGSMNGPLESLKMRGKLDVLGNTDMTYVMRDAELTTDNQLQELVKFTNFQDSTVEVVKRPPLTGLDMSLSMSIDEGAHIMCMLNADHSNYIDLMGGGDLMMNYNSVDNLRLTGRYTLNNGQMKYSLPIIPLKTFTIKDGSYIEFQGDPMDPLLHITATENVKSTVNEGTGSGRVVDFECGVKLSQTLNKLGIEFIIDAPNDVTIQDELNTMTIEGRSKVAITMLASGMYLSDGNTTSFSMNSALSSFLQSEINNVTGTAMRSMGLDLGMSVDNATTSSGGMHTDYNFRFSKRLWNNRLNIIIGGKVSTGAELDQNQRNNSFFDNVELEYRLDKNSSKYLRLFYDNNKYDWLEGPLGQYGIGFKWQRKLQHFKDIFRFKSEKQVMPPMRPDSVKMNDNEKK
jgi:hypothetical protein